MSNGLGPQPSVEDAMSGDLAGADEFDLFNDDEMEAIKEQNKKMAEEHREMARAYARVFSGENGKKVLDDLLSRTVRENVFMPERDNADMLGHIRQGQNTIVQYIAQRINQGQNLHAEGDE